jgi:hypothetical protein
VSDTPFESSDNSSISDIEDSTIEGVCGTLVSDIENDSEIDVYINASHNLKDEILGSLAKVFRRCNFGEMRVGSRGGTSIRDMELSSKKSLIVFTDTNVDFKSDDEAFFLIPRDVCVVSYSFYRREISEAAKQILEKISVFRDYVENVECISNLKRMYEVDMSMFDDMHVPVPAIEGAIDIAQEQYDLLFPGISTLNYKHDNHLANLGDIDMAIEAESFDFKPSKWFINSSRTVYSSLLRTAQGGLNPQNTVALLGSMDQRNFQVERQGEPQSCDTMLQAIHQTLEKVGRSDYMSILKEYNDNPIMDVLDIGAFEEYISKQTAEAQIALVNCDFNDLVIDFKKLSRIKLMYDIYRKLESLGRVRTDDEEKFRELFISFKDNISSLDDMTLMPLLQKAVEIRSPQYAASQVQVIVMCMKKLAEDHESFYKLHVNPLVQF